MRAIVLSGGGSKGAYEIGVWKALKKLNIKYEIVTGTSVGALNAALMTQNTFYKAVKLWSNLNFNMIFNQQFSEEKKEIYKIYTKGILNGEINASKLEETIKNVINYDKFFKSKIDIGIVTFNIKTFKSKTIIKSEMNKDNLCDYLVASASCFPAFQVKKINNECYVDGGYYDNLPINLAISLGATEIIAVDLKEVGIKKRVKNTDIPIKHISPKNYMGSFLIFEKNTSKRLIKYGYNDTMKLFNKYDGNYFTFKKNVISNSNNFYFNKFIINLNNVVNKKTRLMESIFKIPAISRITNKINSKSEFLNIIEGLGRELNIDDSKVYTFSKYINALKENFDKIKYDKIDINNKKIKSNQVLKYIYDLMSENKNELYPVILVFPNLFLQALYLKTVIEK